MNRTRRILSALGLTVALGATIPACTVVARGRVQTPGVVVAYDAPPEPRQENPQPMAGHVWVRGNWTMQNGQWLWIDGHWERQRANQSWQDGRWEPHNGSWHWVAGTWANGGAGGTIVTGDGGVVVAGGGNGGGYPQRDQVQDHRYPQNNNGGQPPLVATNGAGTAVVNNGTVTIYGPTQAPPPARVENPGPSRKGYLWIEGAWQWTNDQYEWAPGHWERTKANRRWEPVRWQQQGNVWVRIGGSWSIN